MLTQAGSQVNADLPHLTVNIASVFFRNQLFIFSSVILIWLFANFKKFTFANEPLSKKAGIFLVVLSVLILMPVGLFVTSGYIRAADTNFGYTQAQSQTSYHIYKPSFLPPGLVYTTKFTIDGELLGLSNATKVVFDNSLRDMLTSGTSKTIVVTQVGVTSDFNIQEFALNYMKDATSQEVPMQNATTTRAYVLQKPLGDGYLTALVFLTDDNVLITLISPKATHSELISLAESFQ